MDTVFRDAEYEDLILRAQRQIAEDGMIDIELACEIDSKGYDLERITQAAESLHNSRETL